MALLASCGAGARESRVERCGAKPIATTPYFETKTSLGRLVCLCCARCRFFVASIFVESAILVASQATCILTSASSIDYRDILESQKLRESESDKGHQTRAGDSNERVARRRRPRGVHQSVRGREHQTRAAPLRPRRRRRGRRGRTAGELPAVGSGPQRPPRHSSAALGARSGCQSLPTLRIFRMET